MKTLLLFIFISLFGASLIKAQDSNKDSIMKVLLIKAKKDPVYIETFIAVHETTNMLDPKSKGLYKSASIINYYNMHLGKYMGRKKSIVEVKERMKSSGQLLEMIQLKIAGRLALVEASQN